MALFDEVKDLVVEILGVDPEEVTEDASFIEDLGAQSMDLMELISTLEEKFGIEVADGDEERLRTVGDVVRYIEEKKGKKE